MSFIIFKQIGQGKIYRSLFQCNTSKTIQPMLFLSVFKKCHSNSTHSHIHSQVLYTVYLHPCHVGIFTEACNGFTFAFFDSPSRRPPPPGDLIFTPPSGERAPEISKMQSLIKVTPGVLSDEIKVQAEKLSIVARHCYEYFVYKYCVQKTKHLQCSV